ncbi:hypothetical protein WME94_55495 [Sorangium sp. So ce429]
MQGIAYDARAEHIAALGARERGHAGDDLLADVDEHDTVGCEVRHTAP